ncbi:hypothetical protein C8F04DRAFT_1083686, partial [Mycena alexandri]
MRKSQRMHLNALFFLLFCCSLLLGQSPQHAMTVTSGRKSTYEPMFLSQFRTSQSAACISHETTRSWARETRIPV